MDEENNTAAQRRKRINMYKKIIVWTIVALIVLPTILCIFLFIKVGRLSDEISDLRKEISVSVETEQERPEQTAPSVSDISVNDKSTEAQTDEKVTEEETEPATEATEEEPTQEATEEPPETVTETTALPSASGEVAEQIEAALKDGRKVVYLTFDDGPGANTDRLLDALAKYNVKATFFINGHTGYETSIMRIIQEGHSLGMHTYTHDYDYVYGSLEQFKEEVLLLKDYIIKTTGFTPYLFRFPGGSSNSLTKIHISTFINYLNAENYIYYDWNVSSGDGAPGLTATQVYDNVMNGINKNSISVVLMHDSVYKESTLEAVPLIIEKLQAMNALILPITADTTPVHHHVN